jgi:hypothetical protein
MDIGQSLRRNCKRSSTLNFSAPPALHNVSTLGIKYPQHEALSFKREKP